MKFARLTLVAAALLVTGAVHASSTPLEFKGLVLGEPVDLVDLKERWQVLDCNEQSDGFTECLGFSSIAQEEAAVAIRVGPDSRIWRISLQFKEGGFHTVLAALSQRYGPPTSRKASTVRNGLGTSFPQETVVWKRPGGATMTALRRVINVDTSEVAMATGEQIRADAARARQKIKDRLTDL